MARVVVVVRRGGVECLDAPGAAELLAGDGREVVRRRASWVEPAAFLPRLLFHAVRRCVTDEGAWAEWTRRWSCRWRVDLGPSGGPLMDGFARREDAIAAELSWLGARHASPVEEARTEDRDR